MDVAELEHGHAPKYLKASKPVPKPLRKAKEATRTAEASEESLHVLTEEPAAKEPEWEVVEETAPVQKGTRFVVQLLGGARVESVPRQS